jgi:integration host factor subunit alpha
MTKIDIVEKIVDQIGMNKKDSVDIVETVLSIVKSTLAVGEDVKISGFGKFEVRQKKDRRGRNPQTGETITIEARRILVFKTSTLLKSAINDGVSLKC